MKPLFRRAAGYQGNALELPVASVDEAIPFYEQRLGFQLVERKREPVVEAVLERDSVRIGLVENGGDSTQDGAFFEVGSVDDAFRELQERGLSPSRPEVNTSEHGSYRAFLSSRRTVSAS